MTHHFNRITVEWNADKGWDAPEIIPHGKLCLEPSATVFHYAAEVSQFSLYPGNHFYLLMTSSVLKA